MEPKIKLPLCITLAGMDVLLTERFFSSLKDRPRILHLHPCFELTCVEAPEGTRFILTPPLYAHMAADGAPDWIRSSLFSLRQERERREDVCDVFARIKEPMEIPDTFDGTARLHGIQAAMSDDRPGMRAQVAAELRLLFVHLARSLYPSGPRRPAPPQTLDEERLGILEACFTVEFRDPACSKSRLAARVGVSERQLSRILAEKYHSSFSELLLRTRMNMTSAMLRQGGSTKAEIAEAVGYTSVASFRRAYKAYFGRPLPKK